MDQLHLIATFLIILGTVIAYVSDRFPMEAVSIGCLSALLLLFGLFPFQDASGQAIDATILLSGFANPALATVMCLLIVGRGLFATDAMEPAAKFVSQLGGSKTWRGVLLMLLAAGLMSAFLNNTPVVVIFIPILTVFAAKHGLAGSRLFLPLSYVSILGGMTTLIGSSTNLVAAGVARDLGVTVGIFDLTGMGLILCAFGGLYVFFIMPKLLPKNEASLSSGNSQRGAQFIGEIILSEDHPFVGLQSQSGMFAGLGDITLRSLFRDNTSYLPPYDDLTLQPGDKLVIAGTRKAFSHALSRGKTASGSHETDDGPLPEQNTALGPEYNLAEAVIAPASNLCGRTIQLSGLKAQFGLTIFGVKRKSRMARSTLSDIRLESGDTLLIGGRFDQFKALRGNHDLLLLEHSAEAVPQSDKAYIAAAIFAFIVLASAFGILPISIAAITGAVAMLATGCLSLNQAARVFDRNIFLLVGSSIALATALRATGGAELIATSAVAGLEGAPPAIILSALFLIIAVMTNLLSNNATAVLFIPIALGISSQLGLAPEPFIAAVIFAANASFATPIGYQTNLLVMGPGHYKYFDYLKAGSPLVLIIWIVFSLLAPMYYGI